MKRRALDDGDDGGRYKPLVGSGTDASAENGSAPQMGRGRRHGAYLRKMRALNEQFAKFVQSLAANPTPLPWDACAKEYVKYAEELREEYKDVLEQSSATGSLLVWGTGDMGQLGLGEDVSERARPTPLSLSNLPVRRVACGGMHTLAVTSDGALWSWGVNDEGALGREVKSSNDHVVASGPGPSANAKPDNEPALVPSISGVVDISAGDSHSVAVTEKGEVFSWGSFRDASGLWCFKPGVKIQKAPVKVFEACGAPVVKLASGVDHILAMTSKGQVYSWGCGERGRLGRLSEAETEGRKNNGVHASKNLEPGLVTALKDVYCTSIGCSAFSSYAVTSTGQVYGWGMNNYGQLGWEVPTEKGKAGNGFYEPKIIQSLSGKMITAIEGGEHHTIALTSEGQVLSFGRPTYGRLGRKDVDVASDEPYDLPAPVTGIEGKVASIAAGVSVSSAITQSGAVYVWGYGETCQLGKGKDETDEIEPVRMKANKAFSGNTGLLLSFGGQHSAMIAKEN
mmetsp:Transcript_7662/g.15589  ORF Transcript_7662/g.15589 Transcript_7662/m.15589 type:complete len:511 (-) Transcript_7662:134-1666(-)|eukprot:CAMPEP_0118934612 /NCGR_PEP_ID=MMETSP1169-20130426/13919_1 /TAXON_ID=36882 /ORGANISM="Pyramimonas obovata, Strain CCMP722" /LENGTH=510 /DNA_ID=CAMNT_0006877533 /DNA_START=150 /DNA_END=1682 /DNA_ORIENTATION=+